MSVQDDLAWEIAKQEGRIAGEWGKDGPKFWGLPSWEERKNMRSDILGRDSKGAKILGGLKGPGVEPEKPLPLYPKANMQPVDSKGNFMSKRTYLQVKEEAKKFRQWNQAAKVSRGTGVYHGSWQTGLYNPSGEKVF